ncbi:NAD-dependent epimerase/dehydratase family protein [Amycolatopsis alkalitolerans]|uniref:NAD-dependent epimerase/dehydratase family protein n=1 Tax=Amycolatopsis alkalitolerans TaxID=2547244 RepID=A0A5C4LU17_9PSEU|nr:NAD-dependent epimerase/dehydratase family protein [Amycolatopsis alkalitolerans]TNC21879.1 NAD-dependent epimerase/dehydratase family protein [Amycolatopsis alkalitolerans]
MKILVTGGAGFIGANLCRALAERHDVIVLDDLSTGRPANLGPVDVDLQVGSVLDPSVLRRACRGVAAIVHLAAVPSVPRSLEDPRRSHDTNVTGTVAVLDAARDVGAHVVLASSSSVYGRNPVLPKAEGLVCRPSSPYAVSKLAAESYAAAYRTSFGLETIAFRFFNVFGPLQAPDHAYAAVIPAFASAALRGLPLTVHGDGTQTRDFTYVDTVVRVLAQAVTGRTTSETPVNLAFGTRTSLNDLVRLLEEELGHRLKVRYRPPRRGDVQHSQACPDTLRSLFPAISPVPLRPGLRRTLSWLRNTVAMPDQEVLA